MSDHIKIFAHRGASGHAFENSFKAFNKAVLYGADGIEVDLQCSKDGHLFIIHDTNLKRLVGVNRFIYDCKADELAKYRLGRRFFRKFSNTRIPTVEEFMEWLKHNPISVNIELKETLLKRPEVLIAWLNETELPMGSHFSSFSPELLKLVKQIRPEFDTAIIVTKRFKWNHLTEMDDFDAVHANKKYYKKLYLNACAEAGKPMRFYAITGEESFIRNPHPVVKGWITDYPKKVAIAMRK